MKKILLTIVWLLSFVVAMNAVPKDTVVTDTATVDEVEVYSDTTTVDSNGMFSAVNVWDDKDDPWDDEWSSSFNLGNSIDVDNLMGMVFVLCLTFLVFVLAPVLIIGIILYFVYKNRREKIRLMEMAQKSGKGLPLNMMVAPNSQADALWNKGIKQVFLGAGLSFLLMVLLGKLGLAIGALIMLIGCGNLAIAQNAKQKQKEQELHDRIFNKPSDNEDLE
ncbi:MAG: hypothetical protein K2G91_04350 [Prevotella sp.]|nr:hypothetical protein [Prevotella sp.]